MNVVPKVPREEIPITSALIILAVPKSREVSIEIDTLVQRRIGFALEIR
jgi:hypothetical protein